MFGFSRGAASGRVFVHKLINEWGKGGALSEQSGQRALPYEVNFLGLFDTVASVGRADSSRSAIDLDVFDGHFKFARNGAKQPGADSEAVTLKTSGFAFHSGARPSSNPITRMTISWRLRWRGSCPS